MFPRDALDNRPDPPDTPPVPSRPRTGARALPVDAALVLIVAVVEVWRAATQSISCDEALTDEWFLSASWGHIAARFDANNHVLNTILAKISVQMLGTSELTVRLPSVLGGCLYLAGALGLVRIALGRGVLAWTTLAALVLDPFLMDYLCAARGYGMALAGLVWAQLLLLRWLATTAAPRSAWQLAPPSLLLGLVVSANLAFGFVALSSGLAALSLLWVERRTGRLGAIEAFEAGAVVCVPGAVLAAALLGPFLARASRYDFYAGHEKLAAAVSDVVTAALFHHPFRGPGPVGGYAWGDTVTRAAPAVALLAGVGVAVAATAGLRRIAASEPTAAARLLAQVSVTLALASAFHVASHELLGLRYPYARGALWAVPLTVLTLALLSLVAAAVRRARTLYWLGVAGSATLATIFALQLNVSRFRDYSYDAGSRPIFEWIRERLGSRSGTPSVVAAPPYQCPSLDFYRRSTAAEWLQPCRIAVWPDEGTWDARVLRPEDLTLRHPWGDLDAFREPVSQTLVFARREPQPR